MLNSIAIQGRLVHTPEAKVTKSGKDVCTFSIACDRQSGGQKETDFFNCTAFGNTALFVSKWFQKGSLILVTGSIQTRKYTDKQGNNRTATEIMANRLTSAVASLTASPPIGRRMHRRTTLRATQMTSL